MACEVKEALHTHHTLQHLWSQPNVGHHVALQLSRRDAELSGGAFHRFRLEQLDGRGGTPVGCD